MSEAPAARAGVPRWLVLLAWLAVYGAALRFAWTTAPQLAQRGDLTRESCQLASVNVLRDGRSLYDPDVYDGVPFTLTAYTPLFFHLVAALPEVPDAPFLPGRLVCLASMLGAAALLFAVPRRRGEAWLAALAAACFLLTWPVSKHAAAMRLDPLALLFSAGAVVLVRRRTPRATAAAALCCLLAVATKQCYLVSAATCALWLGCNDRRLALRFVAWFGGGAVVGALAATLAWGKGFWFSAVVAAMDPPQPGNIAEIWGEMLEQPLFALLTALTLVTAAARLRRDGLRGALRSLDFCYAAASMLLITAMLLKIGPAPFYFFELALAQLMWLLAAWGDAGESPAPRAARARVAAVVLILLTVGLELATSTSHRDRISAASEDPAVEEQFVTAVRAGLARDAPPHPRVLNLGPPRFAYRLADDVCLNDYYLYNVLWTTGRLSLQPLLEAIAQRRFDVVLLTAVAPPATAPGQPLERLQRALRENYRLRGRDDVYSYFVR